MLFEGQLDDDSYQINMSAPCKCVTYKCGGNIVSRKTLRKHAELDYQKLNSTHHARNECALDTPRLMTPELPEIALVLSLTLPGVGFFGQLRSGGAIMAPP